MSRDTTHEYGFTWGPLSVSRLALITTGQREIRVLEVATDHGKVEVSVSRTGRSIRVWRDGKELT